MIPHFGTSMLVLLVAYEHPRQEIFGSKIHTKRSVVDSI